MTTTLYAPRQRQDDAPRHFGGRGIDTEETTRRLDKSASHWLPSVNDPEIHVEGRPSKGAKKVIDSQRRRGLPRAAAFRPALARGAQALLLARRINAAAGWPLSRREDHVSS